MKKYWMLLVLTGGVYLYWKSKQGLAGLGALMRFGRLGPPPSFCPLLLMGHIPNPPIGWIPNSSSFISRSRNGGEILKTSCKGCEWFGTPDCRYTAIK